MAAISIVIPALDERAALGEALDALEPQLEPGDEVWVVDGGSRDATREVAAGRAHLVEGQPPRGRQLNEGLRRSAAPFVLFLHADCRLPPGALALVREALADGRVAGGCFQVVFPPQEIARAPLLRLVERGINVRTRALRQGTGDQALFARREALVVAGGVPEWPLMEDLELCRRLKRAGPFAVLPLPVETSARRWLRGGVIRTQLTMWGFRAAFALGVRPETLGRRYAAIR